MLLIDIAARAVACLAPADSVAEAARLMAAQRISSIVVTGADGRPVGIVTERDMLRAMQARRCPQAVLEEVMAAPVVSVSLSTDLAEGQRLCRERLIRHLVIVDEQGLPVGVVSETDFRLNLNLTALAGRRKVLAVSRRAAIVLPPSADLMQALDLMQAQDRSCVIVVERDVPVGIVTERDVVRLYSVGRADSAIVLGEAMTSPVLSVAADAPTSLAAEMMLENGVRHLVVVDADGRMVGVLNEHDLMQVLEGGAAAGRDNLEERFLRALLDTLPDLVWLKDADGVYQACNARFERFFGAPEREIVGKSDYDFVSAELADAFRAQDRKALAADGSVVNEEWISFDDDGHQELLETIKTPMRNASGKVTGVLGVARDITLRTRAVEGLRASERRYRELVENSPFCIHEIDLDGNLLSMNRAGLAMLELDSEEALRDLAFLDVVGASDVARIAALLTAAQEGRASHFEFTTSAVPPRVFKSCFIPIRDDDDRVLKLMGITEDVTERKRIERQLADQERLFHTIFSEAPSAVELIDPDSLRFIEVNPAACNILGYSHAEYLLLRLTDIQADMDEASLRKAVDMLVHSGSAAFENRHRRKDGEVLDVEVSVRMLDSPGRRLMVGVWRDVSERKRADEKLRKEKQFSDDVINSLPGIFYVLDPQGRFLRVNPQFFEVSGYSETELKALSALDMFAGEDRELVATRIREAFETGRAWVEADLVTKSGRTIPYYFSGHRTQSDGHAYLVGLGIDISERRRAEESLRITASVFDTSQEAIVITDVDNRIVDANPAFFRITGYSRDEVFGRNPSFLASGRHDRAFYEEMWQSIRQQRSWRGEIWNRRKNGEVYAELLSISAIADGGGRVLRHVGVFSDISHIKAHEAELSRIAHYDALTGIPNRVLLADRMRHAITRTVRERNMMAVCYLDLDGFKQVNDTYGHEAGDRVLVEMARRIAAAIRAVDTVARLGGDEFVVLLSGLEKGDECMAILDRLLEAIALPVAIAGKSVALGASIGVSIYPLDDEEPDTLLRHADQAMYAAKQAGKNRYHIYDLTLDLRVRSHCEFVDSIRRGLRLGEFELHYQPMIELGSGRMVGVEALVRWRHPERGLLLPADFLRPVANSDLDVEIGDWVIAEAIAQAERWHLAGREIAVSINISSYHLESGRFVEKLRTRLQRHPGLSPGGLQIEVLETVALNDLAVVRHIIGECHGFGLKFALDDFGTGYSSLSCLSRLPVDALKIDGTFVRGMLEDHGDLAIVQGIIALAQTFGRQTIAEGIEADEHRHALAEMGCMLGQGNGIARPMAAQSLEDWAWPH